MKKIVLALAACGVIVGSGILWGNLASANEEKTSEEIEALAKSSAVLAITDQHSVNQSYNVLERWITQQPKENAQSRENKGEDIHQEQTAQDWAVYYSECYKTEKGCCVTIQEDGTCTYDKKTLAERKQRMEQVCAEGHPEHAKCNQALLGELQKVENMSEDDRQDLLQARAYEARKDINVKLGQGGEPGAPAIVFNNRGNPLTEAPLSMVFPTSEAVHNASHDASRKDDISPEQTSAIRANDAYTRQLVEYSNKSEEQLKAMGVDDTTIKKAQEMHELIKDLTPVQQKQFADYVANEQLKRRKERHADILQKLWDEIQRDADEQRRKELAALHNELAGIQKMLGSENVDCNPNNPGDCYKVYDAETPQGVSVTGGRTMSETIDIR
ncbi:MAG: hypothetical protein J6Y85_04400 [Alphaproteobacteria bacterium]|nr:hypothetical protein [Alphaproteobacteria bacterium]